jgi:hypothetical protein
MALQLALGKLFERIDRQRYKLDGNKVVERVLALSTRYRVSLALLMEISVAQEVNSTGTYLIFFF